MQLTTGLSEQLVGIATRMAAQMDRQSAASPSAFGALTAYLESSEPLERHVVDAHWARIQTAEATPTFRSFFVGSQNDPEMRQALFRLHLASFPKGLDYLKSQDNAKRLGDDAVRLLRALNAETREAMLQTAELADNGMIVMTLPGGGESPIRVVLHQEWMYTSDGGLSGQECCRLLLNKVEVERHGELTLLKRMQRLRLALSPSAPDPMALRVWYALSLGGRMTLCGDSPETTDEDKEDLGFALRGLATDAEMNALKYHCITWAEDAFRCAGRYSDVVEARQLMDEWRKQDGLPLRRWPAI
ncbi:hypothetical protein PAQ31011_01947 [Pandoraea aquatica]|uniref:Uncharacterized protein n=1 Tax=Pandoraea aquatica TaxID=2508290 RepID=A0A5E4UBI0_9BURK|nr:hypothetical protein [Pandoraea aquatica]VVD97161.1 hypothetical protein PAQ31011_01947 [Pandoraea aquatica]